MKGSPFVVPEGRRTERGRAIARPFSILLYKALALCNIMSGYMKCYMLGYMQVTDIPTYIKNKHFLHNTPAFFPGCSVSDAPPLGAGEEIPSGGVAGAPGRGRPPRRPSSADRRRPRPSTVADVERRRGSFARRRKIQDDDRDRRAPGSGLSAGVERRG